MPVIRINESETRPFTIFDATENVVLIPVLYARDSDVERTGTGQYEVVYTEYKDWNIPAVKFTNYSEFVQFMGRHVVTVDNIDDKSYIMAKELLLQGLTAVIKPIAFDSAEIAYRRNPDGSIIYDSEGNPEVYTVNRSITIDEAYKIIEEAAKGQTITGEDGKKITLPSIYKEFEDKNVFNIKFITTGGYANTGLLYEYEKNEENVVSLESGSIISSLAYSRGDAIALLEMREIITSQDKLFEELSNVGTDNGGYAALFFPWCSCSVTSGARTINSISMPASFCYLSAYANSVKTNANWFAAAGVTRGRIPNLITPLFEVGESLMHILQKDGGAYAPSGSAYFEAIVNPIMNAGTYGYRIWGNRVLSGDTSQTNGFLDYLNVRVLMCDIKKQIYHSAMRTTFEPNDDIVWINFKTLINSQLERMKSGRGISWYKWTREYTSDKALIKAMLTIKPIEAVESFDISVVLTDEDAIIEEAQ